jgi:hypothetical protein
MVLTGTTLVIGEVAMMDIMAHMDMVQNRNQMKLNLTLQCPLQVIIIPATILILNTINGVMDEDVGAGKLPVFSFFGGEIN